MSEMNGNAPEALGATIPDLDVNRHVNGHCNGDTPSTNGHSLKVSINDTTPGANGTATDPGPYPPAQNNGNVTKRFTPIAICGMACRLPGGIASPQDLWSFLLSGGDARARKPGSTVTEYGYFLDESVDLSALDTSFTSMARAEVERLDPQQRLLLEVARESLEDAGEVGWRGADVGVYVGSYGNDWYDLFNAEHQKYGMYQVATVQDFATANRLSYEMDLKGPSMTIRTACSSGLIGLNEACTAIAKGDCRSALVGGTNLIMAPALTTAMSEQGALGVDGSCKTFSSAANGYARGEAIVSLYVKSLDDAIRDGNPVRAVISGTATNADGKTPGFSMPSGEAQEALIRHTYQVAGISETEMSKLGFFECHGTGTPVGDPIETGAVARIFGETGGVHIGSIKPNLGHSEGVSGLTSVLKAVLALEHRTIPPNIKSLPLNPKIPFDKAGLVVPTAPLAWPEGRSERVSVNSFGIGGANAHAIIDSAANYRAAQPVVIPSQTLKPSLLLYSANTLPSLHDMTAKYATYVEGAPEDLEFEAVAYTLANRREHLPIRSFAVGTRDSLGSASAPSQAPSKPPTLIMVFTGQGAQWPQMGRDLIRANPIFKKTIKMLDQHLQTLEGTASAWKIEEELTKPSRTSRVDEAEFSQPLCTAIQIAVLDTLASIGIRPTAVVGHSSGEIAAAYAAGALTARESIIVAFLRGVITKAQNRPGGMAAVGLGWDDVGEYVVAGVVRACDNSPTSVTISGDAAKLQEVVSVIKEAHPSVLATTLKVEKAYHSHHMKEVGEEYYRAMSKARVFGGKPKIPFFSSVTGSLLQDHEQMGPRYWQQNLESPVLLRAAATGILRHQDPVFFNPLFLEIGPHAALAGPLRQILTKEGSTAPHIATLTRRQNSLETFLSAVGMLWKLHVDVDFAALMPQGRALSDLPRYPWNHQRTFWYESRVSKEWRMRPHPYHDLLGAKIPETSELEPVFRNLFHLDNVPWVRDHKIKSDIVFPFAGYVAMAAEGVRQITGVQEGVELRHVQVNTALVVGEGAPTEMVTAFRRHRLTDSLDSRWWEFNVSSFNGHAWAKHCFDEVRADDRVSLGEADVFPDERLPRTLDFPKWYERVRRGGLEYGPHFRTLTEGRSSTCTERLAQATIKTNWHGDEANYHVHPVDVDTYFQLLGTAQHGGLTQHFRQYLPVGVDSLSLARCSSDELLLTASAASQGSGVVGKGSCVVGSQTVMKFSGVRLHPLDSNASAKNETMGMPITARCEWVPHVDFQDWPNLIESPHNHGPYSSQLEELGQVAVALLQRSVFAGVQPQLPHLQHYKSWLDQHAGSCQAGSDAAKLKGRFEALVTALSDGPAAQIVAAIAKVNENAIAILNGQEEALAILNTDGTLDNLTTFMQELNMSNLLGYIGRTKPNARVLELGGGKGDTTAAALKELTRSDGTVMYSQYMFTDPVMGLVNSAKERFKGAPNLEFAALNISVDPSDQGISEGQFDLIIAKGLIHETPSLRQSLMNAHKLLDPQGRLLIQQPRTGLTWLKYVFGILPGWWSGAEDGRPDDPSASPERWEEDLVAGGFSKPDAVVLDEFTSTMIARPTYKAKPSKVVSLMHGSVETVEQRLLACELQTRGYTVQSCTMDEAGAIGNDMIVLLDAEGPFFKDLDSAKFETLQSLIRDLDKDGSGLLWVTKLSQTKCQDPSYAPVIGLARTMRSEMAVDFATCETDDLGTPSGCKAVADVFEKFHQRQKGDGLGPDFEYAISSGVTRVNRFFPFDLASDLQENEAGEELALKIQRAGRMDTMHWAGHIGMAPTEDHVEVEIHAAGLNFRDVLVASGIIELPSREPTFGYEASGIVRRVGPAVKNFQVGDRVVLVGIKTFATTVTVTELLVEKLPDEMSFVDGASMPLAFLTAIYSLIEIGGIEASQSILIHSACGGVGLAAIQICQMIGANIYTTVGSQEKIDFLVEKCNIPRHHIFNSRDLSFVDDVMRETGGKGVDLALNALSGELLHATWRCIADWGKMIEIGKRDLIGGGKLDMDVFLANRSYCCVDVDKLRSEKPVKTNSLLRAMMAYHREGHIRPVHLAKVSTAANVQEAFRYMQQGSHIGKIVISFRDNDGKSEVGEVVSQRKKRLQLDPAASYLLVGGLGGLGGLGHSVSTWMVEHGAQNLIMLSRKAGSGLHDADFVREMESMGCSVQLVRGSVTNAADVERAVAGATAPLKGVIQMSMVLRDEMFPRMTIDDWNGATGPKVEGTWNLHQATCAKGAALDFFVLFSSLSGIMGQPGQANYAAANTFLDAFASYRENAGLPCTVLDIGAMEGTGYLFENADLLKKMQGTGWSPVVEEELLEALEAAMQPRASPVQAEGVEASKSGMLLGIAPSVPLSSPDSSIRLRQDVRMAVYHSIGAVSSGAQASGSSNDTLRRFLTSAKANPAIFRAPETAALLSLEIGKKLFGLLLKPDEEPNISMELTELGLDSMLAVEMRAWWRAAFGLDISVLEMLGMGTLSALGKRLADELADVHGGT